MNAFLDLRSCIIAFAILHSGSAVVCAQDDCAIRTFIINTSLNISGFTVQTYDDDQLDSLLWDFGDGETYFQNSDVGSGAAAHTYAAAGTYTVTLERWGAKNAPFDPVPLHCVFSLENVVYDEPTDSMCGGDFLTFINGNNVTFSNQSVIHAPSFNSHSTEPLWDFGNGQYGIFINRIHKVNYAPGTYTACLNYGGFSFNNGGYLYDCETCSTFTVTGDVGLNELPLGSLRAHPNPATSFVELDAVDPISVSDVALLDATGRTYVLPRSTLPGKLRFDVSALASGIYYISVRSAGDMRTIPFIKL